MNYAQEIQNKLEEILKMKGSDYEGLLKFYAQLVLTVGTTCTQKDIHDAWSMWQNETMPEHKSLIPFEQLSNEVKQLDEPYRKAVIKVAKEIHD